MIGVQTKQVDVFMGQMIGSDRLRFENSFFDSFDDYATLTLILIQNFFNLNF